ncbi:MAG: esterase-like activity of phytase family protein, partial [Alphaproteobacteria bacterium]
MRCPSLIRWRGLAKVAVLLLAMSSGAAAEPLAVDSSRVRLNTEDWTQSTIGGLEYRGGLELTSANGCFGGLSGLDISPNGARLLSVSDRGRWVELDLVYDDDGRLAGVGDGAIFALHGVGGRTLADSGKDAEDLARLADGRLAVSFERLHRVVLSNAAPAPGPAVRLTLPRRIAQAPGNGGIEGLTELAPGRLLALTEALLIAGDRVVGWLLSTGGGPAAELFFATTRGFKPTSLATLPDGDVLVLERSYSVLAGAAARLSRIDGDSIVPGALLEGTEIARISLPLTVDNFEGLG